MSLLATALLIIGLGFVAWLTARARAMAFSGAAAGPLRPHSRPNYHGWYVALWAVLPPLVFLAVWREV